jgi:hypothetical protein
VQLHSIEALTMAVEEEEILNVCPVWAMVGAMVVVCMCVKFDLVKKIKSPSQHVSHS